MRILVIWLGFVGSVLICALLIHDTLFFQRQLNPNLPVDLAKMKAIILEEKVEYPDVYLAQVIHETNWLKSNVFKDHSNPSGMHCHPSWGDLCDCDRKNRRESDGTFCHYTSVRNGVRDYKQWQARRLKNFHRLKGYYPKSDEDYIAFLMHFPIGSQWYQYARDKGYAKGVKSHLQVARDVVPYQPQGDSEQFLIPILKEKFSGKPDN